MIVAVTGHRPTGLWGYSPNRNYAYMRQELARRLLEFIQKRKADRFLFGMALGVDSMAFDVCTKIREQLHPEVRLVAAVPYADQAQHWDPEHRQRYRHRLDVADEVVRVDELPEYAVPKVPVGIYDPAKLLARNQYLVDQADLVLAVWTEVERGGTYDTVCRARKAGRELVIYNPKKFYGW